VEPEVAVEIGADGQVAAVAPSLELADIDRDLADVDAVLAENIFHRGVVFGDWQPAPGPRPLRARVTVGGEERASAESEDLLDEMAALTDRLLGELGEELLPGDRIITGTITPPVPVAAGDRVSADFGELGRLEVRVA
jgi:2-keto-4-pentenoate hydratase